MFFNREKRVDHTCSICGSAKGGFKATDGWVCPKCMPLNTAFTQLSIADIRSMHIKDPEIIGRIESFTETASIGDLRFDDGNRLFFKGPYANMTVPILSHEEIGGYRIIIDDRPIAFNSIGGERSVIRVRTDDYIAKMSKKIDSIVLEIDSLRPNIRVRPYIIRSNKERIAETRMDCLKRTIEISDRFDSIIENNILIKN